MLFKQRNIHVKALYFVEIRQFFQFSTFHPYALDVLIPLFKQCKLFANQLGVQKANSAPGFVLNQHLLKLVEQNLGLSVDNLEEFRVSFWHFLENLGPSANAFEILSRPRDKVLYLLIVFFLQFLDGGFENDVFTLQGDFSIDVLGELVHGLQPFLILVLQRLVKLVIPVHEPVLNLK